MCFMQGLEEAIGKLHEGVMHKFCVKHLCANLRKKSPNNDLENTLWEATRATITT